MEKKRDGRLHSVEIHTGMEQAAYYMVVPVVHKGKQKKKRRIRAYVGQSGSGKREDATRQTATLGAREPFRYSQK